MEYLLILSISRSIHKNRGSAIPKHTELSLVLSLREGQFSALSPPPLSLPSSLPTSLLLFLPPSLPQFPLIPAGIVGMALGARM